MLTSRLEASTLECSSAFSVVFHHHYFESSAQRVRKIPALTAHRRSTPRGNKELVTRHSRISPQYSICEQVRARPGSHCMTGCSSTPDYGLTPPRTSSTYMRNLKHLGDVAKERVSLHLETLIQSDFVWCSLHYSPLQRSTVEFAGPCLEVN